MFSDRYIQQKDTKKTESKYIQPQIHSLVVCSWLGKPKFAISGRGESRVHWWAKQKFARELDRGGARELSVGPIFFSDRQIDGTLGFSDRRFNAKYEYI